MAGSVVKRGEVYHIRYNLPTGKGQSRRQRSEACPGLNKKQAEEYLQGKLRKLRFGDDIEPAKITVSEYLDEWLDRIRSRISPTTWESYEKYVRLYLKPAFGDDLLAYLRPRTIQAYYDKLAKRKQLAPKSIRNLHGILRSALTSAARLQLIERNPADGMELPRAVKREAQTASPQTAIRLIHAMQGSKYLLPVLIALGTGVRRGEALALRWEDYNSKSDKRTGEVTGELVIRHSLAQTRGSIVMKETKTGKVAPVPIPASLVALLDGERRRQQKESRLRGYTVDGWICTDLQTGKPLTPQALSRALTRITEKLGIKLSFHTLRHTHATDLLESGVPLKVVSERVRHSNVATTADRYAHVTPTMQEHAVEVAEDLLSNLLNRAVDKIFDDRHPSDSGAQIVRIFPQHDED